LKTKHNVEKLGLAKDICLGCGHQGEEEHTLGYWCNHVECNCCLFVDVEHVSYLLGMVEEALKIYG